MNYLTWYKNLSIQQKINLKELCLIIVGYKFEDLGKILGFKERIELLYNKLKDEGFSV